MPTDGSHFRLLHEMCRLAIASLRDELGELRLLVAKEFIRTGELDYFTMREDEDFVAVDDRTQSKQFARMNRA